MRRFTTALAGAVLVLASCDSSTAKTDDPTAGLSAQTIDVADQAASTPTTNILPPDLPAELPLPVAAIGNYSQGTVAGMRHFDMVFYPDDPLGEVAALKDKLVAAGFSVEHEALPGSPEAGPDSVTEKLKKDRTTILLIGGKGGEKPRMLYSVTFPAT